MSDNLYVLLTMIVFFGFIVLLAWIDKDHPRKK